MLTSNSAQVPRQKAVYRRVRPQMPRFSVANSPTDLDTEGLPGQLRLQIGPKLAWGLPQGRPAQRQRMTGITLSGPMANRTGTGR